jgi:HSP20 family protein
MLFPTLADPRFLAPFHALRQLERLLADPAPTGAPTSFALYRRGDDVLARTVLPGVEAKDLTLEVDGDTLILAGRWPAEPDAEGVLAQHVERPRGEFVRRLRVPFEIDASRVKAELRNGVLDVELPRVAVEPPKKIQVKTSAKD